MKTFIKILILCAVIAGAVAGILCFYNTLMAPPTDSEIINLHKQSVEDKINELSPSASEQDIAKAYNVIIEELELYRKEFLYNRDVYARDSYQDQVYHKITFTKYELNDITETFADKYIPIFYDQCNKKFYNSVWNDSDLTMMRQRVQQLKKHKADYRLTYKENDKLQKIGDIIKDYYDAKRIADNPRFYSVEDAREKIRKADEYRTKSPLSNCEELRDSLANVKKKIGESHYNTISNDVDELEKYSNMNMTQAEAKDKYNQVKNNIEEYDSMRQQYGINETTDEFKKKIEPYQRLYNAPDGIRIYTNSQWTEIPLSNSQYREYKSTSNWHSANSTATMYFTLKGYDTFSFRISSNSEKYYDYVMVGLDKIPTIYSNYQSTQGIQGWKEVTLSGLATSEPHIIYIVYRKYGTVDSGDDCGYVWIQIQ